MLSLVIVAKKKYNYLDNIDNMEKSAMKKKLFFVFNPTAGKAQIKNRLLEIVDLFTKCGYDVLAHPTQNELDAYEQVRARAKDVDMIVCCGGDGTLNEVVSGLMKIDKRPPLGYIPSGSTNDFATSLAIPKDFRKATTAIAEGTPYPCDIGRFNGDTFVYVAAFGAFTNVAYETEQTWKNALGHIAYILEGARSIFNIKSYPLEIEANGEIYKDEYIYGMITNSKSVGGFKNLTGKHVKLDDGLFEVVLIRNPKNPLELNEIVTSLLSGDDKSELIDSFKTDKIVISGEQALSWTLDGEFGGEHHAVTIVNEKHAIEIVLNPRNKKENIPMKSVNE